MYPYYPDSTDLWLPELAADNLVTELSILSASEPWSPRWPATTTSPAYIEQRGCWIPSSAVHSTKCSIALMTSSASGGVIQGSLRRPTGVRSHHRRPPLFTGGVSHNSVNWSRRRRQLGLPLGLVRLQPRAAHGRHRACPRSQDLQRARRPGGRAQVSG